MYTLAAAPIEKIHYVVQLIEHKTALAPRGTPITFSSVEAAISGPLGAGDFKTILEKLERDEQAIVLHLYPGKDIYERLRGRLEKRQASNYSLSITDKFWEYRQKIKAQVEELKSSKPKTPPALYSSLPPLPNPLLTRLSTESKLESKPVGPNKLDLQVSIRFDDMNRYILLSDCFVIAQPDYDSENYRFFEYVWKNPNRTITLDELNQSLEAPLKKSIGKILDNLNFRGPLKDAFFQSSKTSVFFTPTRSIEELTRAGLYPLRLYAAKGQPAPE